MVPLFQKRMDEKVVQRILNILQEFSSSCDCYTNKFDKVGKSDKSGKRKGNVPRRSLPRPNVTMEDVDFLLNTGASANVNNNNYEDRVLELSQECTERIDQFTNLHNNSGKKNREADRMMKTSYTFRELRFDILVFTVTIFSCHSKGFAVSGEDDIVKFYRDEVILGMVKNDGWLQSLSSHVDDKRYYQLFVRLIADLWLIDRDHEIFQILFSTDNDVRIPIHTSVFELLLQSYGDNEEVVKKKFINCNFLTKLRRMTPDKLSTLRYQQTMFLACHVDSYFFNPEIFDPNYEKDYKNYVVDYGQGITKKQERLQLEKSLISDFHSVRPKYYVLRKEKVLKLVDILNSIFQGKFLLPEINSIIAHF